MMHRLPILAIFVLSGAAGLVYEIVWSRQLVLVFGNTTQAVSAILTGFFGGMAIGAAVGGRIADRVRSPLRFYGFLEIALVVVVLVTPFTFTLIDEAYRGVYPSLESTTYLALARLVLAVLALAPATIMMGATFPTLVRHFTRSNEMGQAFGRLYMANTLGAVAGTIVAGLVLIEVFGLSGALRVGAACSAIAGVVALWLARSADREGPEPSVPVAAAAASHSSDELPAPLPWLPFVVASVSGWTSLGYQVTWTRLLSSGTGGLTYVFTVILALCLIGIAVGAGIFNVIRRRMGDPVRFLAWTQFAVAILAMAGLVLVISQPHALDPGRPFESIAALFGSAVLVVLPVTIAMGIAFPTSSELLRDERHRAGSAAGWLLAANTVGAILGSLVIPFVLMPTVGSPAIIVGLVFANIAMGILLAARSRPMSRPAIVTGLVIAVAVAVIARTPGKVVQPNEALIAAKGWTLFESREAEIASVQAGQKSVTAELWVGGTSMTLLP